MIIEKNNQLDDFLLKNESQDCFIIPILSDVNLHPLQNSLCAIYIKIVGGEERMLCFNHGETLKLNSKKLLDLDKLGRKFESQSVDDDIHFVVAHEQKERRRAKYKPNQALA